MRWTTAIFAAFILICLTFPTPAPAQQRVPRWDCCALIYSTGRELGWAAALLEYTRIRWRPSQFDPPIYQNLTNAGNLAQESNIACSPQVKAWPNWRQKQLWLQNQIRQLQSQNDHHRKRGHVWGEINNTYGHWSNELSIQAYGQETLRYPTTCATLYFKLGFDLAYSVQSFRQAQESLENEQRALAQQQWKEAQLQRQRALTQMNRAIEHLRRSDRVLDAYQAIQKRLSFEVRCSQIKPAQIQGIIRRTTDRAISFNLLNSNVSVFQTISDQLVNILRQDCVNPPISDWEHCRDRYCPSCAGTIVLNNVSTDPVCQQCLNDRRNQIEACEQGAEPTQPCSDIVGRWRHPRGVVVEFYRDGNRFLGRLIKSIPVLDQRGFTVGEVLNRVEWKQGTKCTYTGTAKQYRAPGNPYTIEETYTVEGNQMIIRNKSAVGRWTRVGL